MLLPGDSLSLPSTSAVRLGPGLAPQASSSSGSKASSQAAAADSAEPAALASKPGLLGELAPNNKKKAGATRYWLESRARRYVPSAGEPVLGIIIARHADGYRVDIGGAHAASLDAMAFEGATKRNKPTLKVGALVYAVVLPSPPFVEPELACVDPQTNKSAGYGELNNGFLVRDLELGFCRSLLQPRNSVLKALGDKYRFELAVGINGRAWVSVPEGDEANMVAIIKALQEQKAPSKAKKEEQ